MSGECQWVSEKVTEWVWVGESERVWECEWVSEWVPKDAKAYITSDPLAVHIAPHMPRKLHIIPRLPRKRGRAQGTPGHTSDPLAVHIVPRRPRKRGGSQGTPEHISDPLAMHIVPRLPRKRGGAQGTLGRTSDPWQCTLSHACHAKWTWVSEWVREWVRVSEWVSGWVSERASEGGGEWVRVWVWVWVWRTGRTGRRRHADTELKTKTPHVNVGKNIFARGEPFNPNLPNPLQELLTLL